MRTFPKRIVLTGASGFLGGYLARRLAAGRQVSLLGFSRAAPGGEEPLDLRDQGAVLARLDRLKPEAIIHAAALTDVDRCQREPALAYAVNATATGNLAAWVRARAPETRFVYVSSDQVYSGPGPHGEDDSAPVNVYALTKLAGEDLAATLPNHVILRTNFFGLSGGPRPSFADWLVQAMVRREHLRLFHDVYFNPLYVEDLCGLIAELAAGMATGVYNLGGADRISKLEFALRLARTFGLEPVDHEAVSVESASLAAPRPPDMSMDVGRIEAFLGRTMPGLEGGLERMKQGWRPDA